jgi:protoporphyrinogen oxidase
MNARPSVTIVGAGVAGLTLAHQLASTWNVQVVEAGDTVGGLGRSWHYGDFHFDVGPHRFHTEQPRVAAFIQDVLAEDALPIRRRSGARMFGRFHEWPLRPSVLLSMPFRTMVGATRDLFFRKRLSGDSFEVDVLNKYGRTIYDIFFKPYTEKFLFHSPAELHRDWGRAGVNRAVIDKRANADSLWGLLKTTFLPTPVDTMFLYAPHGVGRFSERLASRVAAAGGTVTLCRPVTTIDATDDRIEAVWVGDRRVPCDNLIWTAPLITLTDQLGIEDPGLSYLSTLFYNIELARPVRHDYQWIYYGGDEIFSRISIPQAFADDMVPSGKGSLCVEVTCLEGDERWQAPEQLTRVIVEDLVRTRTIERAEDVERVHIEPVRDTYPIYRLDYLRRLTATLKRLEGYRNLLLAGRSARFWYNNMDHSIGQGLTMADKILRGTMLNSIGDEGRDFWE